MVRLAILNTETLSGRRRIAWPAGLIHRQRDETNNDYPGLLPHHSNLLAIPVPATGNRKAESNICHDECSTFESMPPNVTEPPPPPAVSAL